jgi:K+-transporting ATPase A subunit
LFITAFPGALIIGWTPEYLGKKIATRQMQFASRLAGSGLLD